MPPLNYAYHLMPRKLARLLLASTRASSAFWHVEGTLNGVARTPTGAIGHIETLQHGRFDADPTSTASGFRAELITSAGQTFPLGA